MNFKVVPKLKIYGMKYIWVTFRRPFSPIVDCAADTMASGANTTHGVAYIMEGGTDTMCGAAIDKV